MQVDYKPWVNLLFVWNIFSTLFYIQCSLHLIKKKWGTFPQGQGGGVTKRLMGMCHWMGSHFHNWINYNGVAFSIELVEWGRTFCIFWGKAVLHNFG